MDDPRPAPDPPAAPWLATEALRPLGGVASTWGYLMAGGESDEPRAQRAADAEEVARKVRVAGARGPWFAFAPGDTHIRTIYEFDELADAVAERGARDARRALTQARPKALLVVVLLTAGVLYWPADRQLQMLLLLVAIFFVVPLWRQGVEAAFDAWRDLRRIAVDAAGWRRRQARQLRFAAYSQSTSSIAAVGLVASFALVLFASFVPGFEMTLAKWGLLPAAVRDGEYWRLLSSAFLHGGLLHIIFNSMAGLSLAGVARSLVNETRILVVFLLSVLAGSVASSLASDVPSVGASGGVLGWGGLLTGLALVHPDLRGTGLISMMLRWVVLIALIGVVGMKFIDNAAHAGGFAGGFICGLFFARFQGARLPVGTQRLTIPFLVLATATAAGAVYLAINLARMGL